MSVRPAIVIAHPEWDERRRECMARLEAELRPQCEALDVPLIIHRHQHKDSHLPGAIEAIEAGLATGATHVVTLPDDVLLVADFVKVLRNIIEARPDDVLDMLSNHEFALEAYDKGNDFYRTIGGSVMIGGVMRAQMWRAYLDWRKTALRPGVFVPIDNGLNMWAMLHGHDIYKPLPSPVQHDISIPSLNGNDAQDKLLRTSQVWFPDAKLADKQWGYRVADLGRTFHGQHWDLLFATDYDAASIEIAFRAGRHGRPVDSGMHLMLATPGYTPLEPSMRTSRDAVVRLLIQDKIKVTICETAGDSLVTRGRHNVMHEFLSSPCTHLLQWDADIECLTPEAVIAMLATSEDVIGGAYPFRDGSGHVVANQRIEDMRRKAVELDGRGCMRVAALGTGFLMTSRKAIVELCARYQERLYEADIEPYRGCPMWALFDVALVTHPTKPGRRRYLSEDWEFCRLWRELGHDVWCYTPARFRHWGKKGHEGNIIDAWGMRPEAA